MNPEEARLEIARLSAELERHNQLYYENAQPEISDADYDRMFRDLELLEAAHPDLASPNSPTKRVGGKPIDGFEQREHVVRMLSIDDVFSEGEVHDFFKRMVKNLGETKIPMIIEPKIDGVAVSMIYRNGELEAAVTRGDGTRGDVITENVRTIRGLPLTLGDKAPEVLEIRGEIYMPNEAFAKMNEERDEEGLQTFANPRNATAGTLKLLDSREVAKRPLAFIAHGFGQLEGISFDSFSEFRSYLEELKLPANHPVWLEDNVDGVIKAIRELDIKRHDLEYGTDGAVVKVDSIAAQAQLGATSRAPRWSMAFKYPPEQKETVLHDITIQVGRTGTLTPVAELEPVLVSGTTVRRATLHNQDEIDRKDVRIGDTVVIEKAGEIIPAVVKVVTAKRPADAKPFNLYEYVDGKCPRCNSPIIRPEGFVAWKCENFSCPAQASNRLKQFVSRKALDIDGVGNIVAEKLVERGKVKDILDIFELHVDQLADFNIGTAVEPRMLGEKNGTKIVETARRAREAPLAKWLYGLGIPQVGESAALEASRLVEDIFQIPDSEIIEMVREKGLKDAWVKENPLRSAKTADLSVEEFEARKTKSEEYKRRVKELTEKLAPYEVSPELGGVASASLLGYFRSESGQAMLERMKQMGICPKSTNYLPEPSKAADSGASQVVGKTFVITGTLTAPRNDIKAKIQDAGGKVSGSISSKTDFLLAGEGGGSKRDKAETLGVTIISEEDLEQMLFQE
ncbi:MAG: NAD-dependent DNA ligase LigA [Verrucomicrobiales bacterium]|nr:NAD-dependent DNA ligase LigA [Verrucomicrobiales bacterium]